MSKREDYLSALRADLVRVLRDMTDMQEARAVVVAEAIIKAIRLRYEGMDLRIGRARISDAAIRAAFNGRNHEQVCRDLGISRRTLYCALKTDERGKK